MRDSRSRRGGRLSAAAVLLLSAALPAAAQTLGAPVPLLPGAPAPAAAASPSSPATPAAGAGGGSDIAAQPLAPSDASWSGVLGPDQGGFPDTMWRGTARVFVDASLPLLAPSTSPVLQDLARRLLLSNGMAPAGDDPSDRPPLAAERLGALLALGDVSGATGLLGALPSGGEDMDRARIELRFAANDRDGACQAVSDGIAKYQGAWWDRALIACETLAGDRGKAQLGMSVLADEKAPPDPEFDTLVAVAGGSARRIDKLPAATPMRVSLLAAAKAPLPADALAGAGPAALLAYATNEKVPLERRLPVAERAAEFGAMPPDALVALYRALPTTPEERDAALSAGAPPADAKMRALLYQVALSSAPDATRETALALLVADAQKRGFLPLAARLAAPVIETLDPTGAAPDFAADAARILLLAGEGAKAAPWLAAAGDKALALVATLGAAPADPGAVHDAVADLAGRNGAAGSAQGDLLVTLVAAFDGTVNGLDWAPLMAPPHAAEMPNAALWLDDEQAVDGKRLGETVLCSILLVAAGEHLSLEPVLLERAVTGLRAVGLEADAQKLATEAALDAGI